MTGSGEVVSVYVSCSFRVREELSRNECYKMGMDFL
jgi:hypothetical protein